MPTDDVSALVRAIVSKVSAELPRVQINPGQVIAYSDAAGALGTATVRMDGDPSDSSVDVTSLAGSLNIGDRVMVLFDPPQGAYVLGRVGGEAAAAGRLYLCGPAQILNPGYYGVHTVPFDRVDFLEGGVTRSGGALVVPKSGLWSVSAQVGWSDVAPVDVDAEITAQIWMGDWPVVSQGFDWYGWAGGDPTFGPHILCLGASVVRGVTGDHLTAVLSCGDVGDGWFGTCSLSMHWVGPVSRDPDECPPT